MGDSLLWPAGPPDEPGPAQSLTASISKSGTLVIFINPRSA